MVERPRVPVRLLRLLSRVEVAPLWFMNSSLGFYDFFMPLAIYSFKGSDAGPEVPQQDGDR